MRKRYSMHIVTGIGAILFLLISFTSATSFGGLLETIGEILKELDVTDPDSEIRETGREFDEQRLDATDPLMGLCMANAKTTKSRNIDYGGGPRNLSPTQKYFLRQRFGELIDRVTVIWNAYLNDHVTYDGRVVYEYSGAQTYGYRIYIEDKQKPNNTDQIMTLAHELVHVQQYERYEKSLNKYCRKYMDRWVDAQFSYFDNELEHEAFSEEYKFASWLSSNFYDSSAEGFEYESESPNIKRRLLILPVTLTAPLTGKTLQTLADNRFKNWYLDIGGSGNVELGNRANASGAQWVLK